MIANRVRGLTLLHLVVQVVAVLALFWLWAIVVFKLVKNESFETSRYLVYSGVIAGAIFLDLTRSKLIRTNLLHMDVLRNHQVSLRQTLMVLGVVLVFLVAAKDLVISRAFLFSWIPFLYLVFFLTNRWVPRFLARCAFTNQHCARTVLLGSSKGAESLRTWLERKASYGIQTVGLVNEGGQSSTLDWLPTLGNDENLEEILTETKATQLVAMNLPEDPERIIQLGDLCNKLGIRLFIINNLSDKLHRPISLFEDDGLGFIGFRQEPLECPLSRLIKRGIDLAIATPVVVFLLPVVSAVVWLCQRRQSPGPLFFLQKRTGKHNSEFSIFKYRTMHVNHGQEALQATEGDPRIYPAGRIFRKLSIDELPQFINVLRGEMSIVGPRPHLVHHDRLFGEIANYYRIRSLIKPGITGLAQVRGLRGETHQEKDLTDRILSDLYYLEHWSPLMELMIIAKTIRQVIHPPKTAY